MASKYEGADCKWYDPFAKAFQPQGDKGWFGLKLAKQFKEKPIAYSTISTAEHIRGDAKDYATLNQLREKYAANPLLDEELAVVEAYVKRGYGGVPAKLAIKCRHSD